MTDIHNNNAGRAPQIPMPPLPKGDPISFSLSTAIESQVIIANAVADWLFKGQGTNNTGGSGSQSRYGGDQLGTGTSTGQGTGTLEGDLGDDLLLGGSGDDVI